MSKKALNRLTDLELIGLYKQTDQKDCIGELFVRYTHLIFGVCYKYLKDEDACQDVLMDVFEKLLKDVKKYDIQNFSNWLHSMVRNKCMDRLRYGTKVNEHNLEYGKLKKNEIEFMEKDTFDRLFDENSKDLSGLHLNNLETALKKLKEEYRVCLELFYLKDLSYKEVEQKTGYSNKQVKSYIQNGKRMLKKILVENN